MNNPKPILEKINGYGWLLGVIINAIMLAIAVTGLYWKLHEEIAVLKVQNAYTLTAIQHIQAEVAENWRRAEREHDRMEKVR